MYLRGYWVPAVFICASVGLSGQSANLKGSTGSSSIQNQKSTDAAPKSNSAEADASKPPSWIYRDEVAPAVSWLLSLEEGGPFDLWQKFLNVPLGAYDTWKAVESEDPTVSPFSLLSVKQVTADVASGIGPALAGLGPALEFGHFRVKMFLIWVLVCCFI